MTGLGVSYRLELDTAGLVDLDAVAAVADAFLSKPSSFTGETVAKQVVGDRLELHKTAVAGQSHATAEAVRAVMSQHGALRPFTLTEDPAGDHPGARTEFIPGHGLRSPRPPWPEQDDPAHRVGMDTKAALPASFARSMPEQGQSSSHRGLCPVCEQDVPLTGSRFPRHRAPSGGWFEACIVEGAREPHPLVPAGRTFTQALTDAGYRVEHYRSGDDYRLVAYAPHAPADHYLVAVWRARRFLRALVAFPESATFHNSLAGLRRDLAV